MNILGISGSLRAGSYNTSLIRAAADVAPDGVSVSLHEGLSAIPPYNEDEKQQSIPDAVTRLAEAVVASDAVLMSTPEYNYGVPGVLKNAIDWLSRTTPQPFKDKPMGIVGAAMGALGTARAQYDLRRYFIFLEGLVLNRPEVFVGAAHQKFDDAGKLTDEAARTILSDYMVALEAWVKKVG